MKPSDFCSQCMFYLHLHQQEDKLMRVCRNCGYQEEDKKGGLILEIDLKEKTSEGYRIIMNEFTPHDPTLPHTTSIKCHNDACESNTGAKERDVLYMKFDPVGLKFLYYCMVCNTQWRSKA